MLVFTCYLLRFKLWDKFLLAIAHAPASAQAMFWSTCIHSHLKTSSQRIGVQWILFPEYFWIPRQKLPKSLYFEKNKVRRSDMLSSYTQKNKYLKLSMTSLFTLQSDYEILWNLIQGSMKNPSICSPNILDSEAKISKLLLFWKEQS
jgi:hypothetical protein